MSNLKEIQERHEATLFIDFEKEFDPEWQPQSLSNAHLCHLDRGELLTMIDEHPSATLCQECRRTYFVNNKNDKCPHCVDKRISELKDDNKYLANLVTSQEEGLAKYEAQLEAVTAVLDSCDPSEESADSLYDRVEVALMEKGNG